VRAGATATRGIIIPFSLRIQQRTMSSASTPSQPPSAAQENHQEGGNAGADKKPLPLPEPSKDGDTISLNVDGEGVKLDHLGPLVVNQDGTMSRIANWAEMSGIERDNTLRILGKRNQLRLKTLREAAAAPGAGAGAGADGQ
jgi:hypothetical protein